MADVQISSNGTNMSHPLQTSSLDANKESTSETYSDKVKKMANDASSQVSRFANDTSTQVASAYDGATSAVGRRLNDTGRRVEQSDLLQRTGRTMSDVGTYLDDAKLEHISSYARDTVRRNPLAAVAIGVGAGILLGRWISK